MSDPIVMISHSRVKEDKLDDLRQYTPGIMKQLKADKPGTLVQLGYLSEDSAEVTFVHVFPNADAFDLHLQGASGRVNRASDFMEAVSYEIYGTPSPGAMEMMNRFAGSRIPLSVNPEHFGGFIRPKSG